MIVNSVSQTNFNGLNPKVAKNQMKVLLTQDIWAPALKVKMPESEMEKETLLEILEQRAKLDRYARLTNEKLNIKGVINRAYNLIETNPDSDELQELLAAINKKGNVNAYLKTLNKNIELERNKRKDALDYFADLGKLTEEYEGKKLVKNSALNKFWAQVVKNNINPDEKLSTKELIEIIKKGETSVEKTETPVKAPVAALTKKQLFKNLEKEYEFMLRSGIDIYTGQGLHNVVASTSRKALSEKYASAINKFPNIKKQLIKLYENIEERYTFKVDRLGGVDIHPLSRIWNDMFKDEASMKSVIKEINNLKSELANNPNDNSLKERLEKKEIELIELKGTWVARLGYSIKYADENRELMKQADRLAEYDYLTAENKTLLKHKKAHEAYKNNNDYIPDSMWDEILK